MKIREAAEDYLEAILILRQHSSGKVRSIDIARLLEVSKPSVSVAMKNLRDGGFIEVIDNCILLTAEGEQIAQRIYGRHRLLTELLKTLGVNEQTAENDACKIEHDLSEESISCLRGFYDRYLQSPHCS